MIGIIGAMHEEVVELNELLKNKSVIKEAGMDFYMGLLNDKEVVVVEGGIGKVNAAVCTTLLINKFNAEKVIFTGVAGGINPILNVGDIVISSDLIQHDVDVTAFGCKFGEIPRMKEYIFKADKKLAENSYNIAKEKFKEKNVVLGRVLSGDQFINSIDKITWLRNEFLGDCVEMEGASVAQVCYLYNKPFVVIRSISDKADHSAGVDFNEFKHEAARVSKEIVINIL